MPEISQTFIDPKTGRIRALADYAPEIANAPANKAAVELSPLTRPQWFKPDGTIKSTAEIRDDEARAKLAADIVAAKVRAHTQKTLTDDERLIQSLDSMIEKSAKEAKYSTHPAERVHHQEYTDHLKARKAEVETKISEEKRVAALAENRSVQLAREHSSTYLRSPPPGADLQAVAVAVALSNRTDTDPATLVREYWTAVEVLEANALQVVTKEAQDKREAALHAEMVAAQSDVTVVETRQRIHQAQEAANGPQ